MAISILNIFINQFFGM